MITFIITEVSWKGEIEEYFMSTTKVIYQQYYMHIPSISYTDCLLAFYSIIKFTKLLRSYVQDFTS